MVTAALSLLCLRCCSVCISLRFVCFAYLYLSFPVIPHLTTGSPLTVKLSFHSIMLDLCVTFCHNLCVNFF